MKCMNIQVHSGRPRGTITNGRKRKGHAFQLPDSVKRKTANGDKL